MKIFDCENFVPFQIASAYEALCSKISPKKQPEALTENGYCILPLSWKNQKAIELLAHTPILDNHFAIAKLSNKNFNNNLHLFKKELLILFISWLKTFLTYCHEHLSKRESNGVKIIQMPHIQQSIGKIISQLEFTTALIMQSSREKQLTVAANFCRETGRELMKLPGGRAFLKGSIIEVIYCFEAFYNVYFIS